MIAYIDSSVLLRIILGQRDRLKEWARVTRVIASALAEVECLRTLDRLRLNADGGLNCGPVQRPSHDAYRDC